LNLPQRLQNPYSKEMFSLASETAARTTAYPVCLMREIMMTIGLMRYDMHLTKEEALFLVRGENCQPVNMASRCCHQLTAQTHPAYIYYYTNP
jgi:hypothetical protein